MEEHSVILTRRRRHEILYSKAIDISKLRMTLPLRSLANKLLCGLAESSRLIPLDSGVVESIIALLNALLLQEEGRSLLLTETRFLKNSDLHSLFRLGEDCCERYLSTPKVRTDASMNFRRIVLRHLAADPAAEPVTRETLRFVTRYRRSNRPRPLISDHLDKSCSEDDGTPLATLRHDSIAQLLAKQRSRVERDLNRIRTAAVAELEFWRLLRVHVEHLMNSSVMPLMEARYGSTVGWGKMHGHLVRQPEDKVNQSRLTLQLQHVAKNLSHGCTYSQIRKIPDLVPLLRHALSSFDQRKDLVSSSTASELMCLPHRACAKELFAALVLLLTHTGWNTQSMLTLKGAQIEALDDCYALQAYKSKTDDHTPIFFLEKREASAAYALELVLWNHKQLKSQKAIEPSEQRLWLSPKRRNQPFVLQPLLQRFRSVHQLPPFSLEQIRTQVLYAASLARGGLEAARHMAGHSSISTTAHYLDQLIQTRLSEAINLEFQRRLQATVVYMMNDRAPERSADLADVRHIDQGLLASLGDGASCRNPAEPPRSTMLVNGHCESLECHCGDGCPNRVLLLTLDRLVELVRSRRMYQSRWRDMVRRNADRFQKFHIPAILFNRALYDFVDKGPYGYLLRQIEARVEDS